MENIKAFDNAAEFLPERLKNYLQSQSDNIKKNTYEIRIRLNKPIALVGFEKMVFVAGNGTYTHIPTRSLPCASEGETEEAFNRLCKYSVYAYMKDLINGFVTTKDGHRVGICSTAVVEEEKIVSIRDVTSLNIRIAKDVKGVADKLITYMRKNNDGNILIVGPPSSGKTTLLRDLSRQLSDGSIGKMQKVCVVDERQEIFSSNKSFEEGMNTDLLLSFPKATGIECAVRTLSPDYIVTDEIATDGECQAICNGLNCGVKFALSIHASSVDDLKKKEIFLRINKKHAFENIVILKGASTPCEIERIISYGEI